MADRRRPKGDEVVGLEDELENVKDANLWKELCGVQQAMTDYPDQAAVIFDYCTTRRDKPATGVAKVFKANGINISYQTVQRHRGRRCRCDERMPERYES